MNGCPLTEIYLSLEELEDIVATLKQLGKDRCVMYHDSSSGIGSTLDIGVQVDVDGIKGELKVPITDESSW